MSLESGPSRAESWHRPTKQVAEISAVRQPWRRIMGFDPRQQTISATKHFAEYLSRKGKRMTRQRDSSLPKSSAIMTTSMWKNCWTTSGTWCIAGKVSRPTVYRTLTELVDAGLLRKITIGKRAVYEHEFGYPRHDHFFCQNCGKLIEFHSRAFGAASRSAGVSTAFKCSAIGCSSWGYVRTARLKKNRPAKTASSPPESPIERCPRQASGLIRLWQPAA